MLYELLDGIHNQKTFEKYVGKVILHESFQMIGRERLSLRFLVMAIFKGKTISVLRYG